MISNVCVMYSNKLQKRYVYKCYKERISVVVVVAIFISQMQFDCKAEKYLTSVITNKIKKNLL